MGASGSTANRELGGLEQLDGLGAYDAVVAGLLERVEADQPFPREAAMTARLELAAEPGLVH